MREILVRFNDRIKHLLILEVKKIGISILPYISAGLA
mgnify:CR=1 FL=1